MTRWTERRRNGISMPNLAGAWRGRSSYSEMGRISYIGSGTDELTTHQERSVE